MKTEKMERAIGFLPLPARHLTQPGGKWRGKIEIAGAGGFTLRGRMGGDRREEAEAAWRRSPGSRSTNASAPGDLADSTMALQMAEKISRAPAVGLPKTDGEAAVEFPLRINLAAHALNSKPDL
jgi:hypothetical protein